MNLSITTDYARDTGNPAPYLRRIAEAGFTHVHWCHHWNDDFLYSRHEIHEIQNRMKQYHLQLLDLHGSAGQEKRWTSPWEWERRAGVELVRNRIEMTARLGGDVVIMHAGPADETGGEMLRTQLRKSLDELEPVARHLNVKIAIENGDWDIIRFVLREYPPDFAGLCYDSGHGNLGKPDGLTELVGLAHRLVSIHLHDNDGTGDQHNLLFTGTVRWTELARIITGSSYTKCISMETVMYNTGISDERVFLEKAYATGKIFSAMVEKNRGTIRDQ